ncbi:nonribosomal peptide synthetase [Nemania sp. FL0916]|nr:nonribosomal peptide synthetase [Nemania sp. FL0916]
MGSKESNGVPYGRRLIPHVIDEIAYAEPIREAFQIPRSAEPKDGWEAISFKTYANAINRCARKIIDEYGRAPEGTFPVIAYIGPQDARYVVFMVAAIKVGWQALYISPRNSQEGQLNLFEKTDCHVIWFAQSFRKTVQPWLEERPMKSYEVGSLNSWFSVTEVPHVPYVRTFEQAEWEPLCILHTSGSTGLPKPIFAVQGMLAISDAYHNYREWNGYTHWVPAWTDIAKRHYLPMPLFHAAGLYTFIFISIYFATSTCFTIPDIPLSADFVVESLSNMNAESAILPPSILEDISQSEHGMAVLKKLNMVAFGGGNLAQETGDRLVRNGIILSNIVSSTEFAPYPLYFQPKPELWQYFIINRDLFGVDWRKADGDACELVIVRKDKNPGLQGFFYTFPDLDEYSTHDLFIPHPSLPDHWAYHGRADNIIVFSNGEKLNPITIEGTIQDHPRVKGAIVLGSGKFQPALLLEPFTYPKNHEEEIAFIDDIWPLVEKANSDSVAHGYIIRDLVTITDEKRPFLRTGKGTIQRAATSQLYKDDMDRLYEGLEDIARLNVPDLNIKSEESLSQTIVQALSMLARSSDLDPDTNFFAAGIDSLQVINASRLLRAGLAAIGHVTELPPRTIYNNPTPRQLAKYILRTIVYGDTVHDADEEAEEHEVSKLLYDKYTHNLFQGKPGRPNALDQDQTVLLTGSTGALGSYLLDQLVRNPAVARVVCLNRAEDGGVRRQATAMKDRGLETNYSNKAEFYQADFSRPDFGLSQDVYEYLSREADRVIHNAWPVNFNISTETFEPHIRGVRHLADFASQAKKRVAIIFISSVSAVDRWDTRKGPVPEEKLDDWDLPGNGYGRSKMIGGMILEKAGKVGDFPAASIRVGQIAGPESKAGAWAPQEWLPSIIASSLHMSALPNELGRADRVDWTPIERVAKLVLDISGTGSQSLSSESIHGYFHAVNPSATFWKDLAPSVQQFYGGRIKELVSFNDWVSRLEKSQVVDSNPGVKLLDTYRAMSDDLDAKPVVFNMQRTTSVSPAMKEGKPITPQLMTHWCAQWRF